LEIPCMDKTISFFIENKPPVMLGKLKEWRRKICGKYIPHAAHPQLILQSCFILFEDAY